MNYYYYQQMTNKNEKICSTCKEGKIELDEDIGKYICDNCRLEYEGPLDDEEENQTTRDDDKGIQLVEPQKKIENVGGGIIYTKENGKKKAIKQFSKPSRIDINCDRIKKLLQGKVLKNIIDETQCYYKIIDNNNINGVRGRNMRQIIIGIYYYVLRKNNQAKTIKEISSEFNVKERIVKKAINGIKFDIIEPMDENKIIDMENNYVDSFIGGGINTYNLKLLSHDIIGNFNKNDILEGKSPKTVAGLSLILASKLLNDNLFDNEDFFSNFSSKNTLEKSFEEIKSCLKLIIPQKYADKINELQSRKLFF